MPPLTPADATLILDHVLGDRSLPAATVQKLLPALPLPSHRTPRLRRALLLHLLAANPLNTLAIKTLHDLASLTDRAATSTIAAVHIAVAAFQAVSAPDFDAAARTLFARPDGRARLAVAEGGIPALAAGNAIATVDQFEAAIGNSSAQTILRGLWGNQDAAEMRVRDFLAAEWAAIGPSMLEAAAERIVGDGAVETWRAADEVTRSKFRILAGEEKTREILGKLEEPTASANPISTPAVEKVIDALKTSCAHLHNAVEDPLPAAKAAADEVLAARMDKGVSLNAEEVRGQPMTRGAAGPSTLNDKVQGASRGKPHNLMDRNPTARTSQRESPYVEVSESSLRRPHLPSPRRLPVSPPGPPKNKNPRRRPRKEWSVSEQETLRKGVQQYGMGNWMEILDNNRDVFIGRTTVDLKDKWRNMTTR